MPETASGDQRKPADARQFDLQPSGRLGVGRPNAMIWRGRLRTASAMVQLLLAMALVHFVPMRKWRNFLGSIADSPILPSGQDDPAMHKSARRHALHVSRAASYFPFTVKCLPRAMVLQWQLRQEGAGSHLVIAMLKAGHLATTDRYHAWVELDGEILIGSCERSDYAVLMTLSNLPS